MNLNLTVVYSNLMVSISNDIMCFEGVVVEVSRSGTVKGKMTTESLSAVAWLQDFCNSYAEKLPNENKLNLPPPVSPNSTSTDFIWKKPPIRYQNPTFISCGKGSCLM